jgi:hypothetical protein
MTLRDKVDLWLHGLGRAGGVDIALDESGAVGLALASGLVLGVELDEPAGLLHLHCGLLRLPAASRAAVLEEAMALNLFGRGTGGATLGLERPTGTVVLSVSRDAWALEAEDFAALLDAFGETAESLRDRLLRVGGEGPPADGVSPVPPKPNQLV